MRKLLSLFILGLFISLPLSGQTVFINEIHYENINADEGEFLEIAGPAETDLTNWKIVFYDGSSGTTYGTVTLAGQIPNTCGGFGVVAVDRPGIENGDPDGLALVDNSSGGDVVIQFLSYEGVIVATGGPANGQVSMDIGVRESSTTAIGHSLQLSGTGEVYTDFAWSSPATNTRGACNTGQIFSSTSIPSVTLSVDFAQIAEDSGMAQFAATLSNVSAADVTVNLTFSGTATRLVDYVDLGDDIIIPAGQLIGVFTVVGNDDTDPEANETITLTINSVTANATIGDPSQATTTIIDDDSPPVLTLSVDNSVVDESGGGATVTAELSKQVGVSLTVSLSFAGTATKDLDYSTTASSITILPGSSSGTISLNILQDTALETDEIILVSISSVSANAIIGNPNKIDITIVDDDSPTVSLLVDNRQINENAGIANVSAVLSFIVPEEVTVELNFSGTATGGGVDYSSSSSTITIPAFQGLEKVVLTAVDDPTLEENETIVVEIASVSSNAYIGDPRATVTILDDDLPTPTVVGFLRGDANTTHESGITLNEISARSVFDFNVDGQIDSQVDQDEFIEIVNSSLEPIDINGWVLGDNNDNFVLSGIEPFSRPHGVTVFTRGADITNFDPGPGNQVIAATGLALHDENDAIGLKNTDGLYVSIHWGTRSPDRELNAEFLSVSSLVGHNLMLAHEWTPGQSQTRSPDYTGAWRRHPVLPGNFDWSLDGGILLNNPSASPSRRSNDGIPLPSEKDVALPNTLILRQNYPNPFNPSTLITYLVPDAADVRLEIFDLLGKRIRLLEQGVKPSGQYEVTFDASGLSSGVYFYTLTAGNFTQTRKMVVVK